MKRSPANLALQRDCCAFLGNLMAACTTAPFSDSHHDLDLLIAALQSFPDDASLQAEASAALANFFRFSLLSNHLLAAGDEKFAPLFRQLDRSTDPERVAPLLKVFCNLASSSPRVSSYLHQKQLLLKPQLLLTQSLPRETFSLLHLLAANISE